MQHNDKLKLYRLIKVSIVCAEIRLFIYLLPWNLSGLILEILWVPSFFAILAIPIYVIEWLMGIGKE